MLMKLNRMDTFPQLFPINLNDSLFEAIEQLSLDSMKRDKTYPFYNVYKKDDKFFIELAVTGFSKDDISIFYDEEGMLVIEADKTKDEDKNYLHKSLTTKNFTKKFQLLKFQTKNIEMDNGILTIELEKIKPKKQILNINYKEEK